MSNCKLQSLYLATVKVEEVLDEFEGEKGTFFRSFLISTKTNLNDWEVTEKANQTDGPDFTGQPGIEFWNKGRRDHTIGASYTEAINMQTPHTKAIIRKVLGSEKGERLEQVSIVLDEDIAKKLRNKEIQYVSPAIFPRTVEDVEIIEKPGGGHIHRIHRYFPLHYAFVDDPAYEQDAKITDVCDGPECLLRLSKASKDNNVIPPIIRVAKCSKTGKTTVQISGASAKLSDKVSECLSNKLSDGQEPTDQDIAICYSEAQKANTSQILESKNKNIKMSVDENKKKDEEIASLKKANEESQKKHNEEVAKLRKANDSNHEPNKQEIMISKIEKAMDEEDHEKRAGLIKKAMDENDHDDKEKKALKKSNEIMKEDYKAAMKLAKAPLIEEYLAGRKVAGDTDEEIEEKKAKMEKASLDEVQGKLNEIKGFVAQTQFNQDATQHSGTKFPMGVNIKQLSGSENKTPEQTYEEVYGE